MTLPFLFAGVGLLGLFLILYLATGLRAKGGNLDELTGQLRPIDVEAFRNLIDEREQEYLRTRLPPTEFRSIHRERMLAAVEYVRCASQNAAILTRLGEAARQNPDPAVGAAAEKLVNNALRLRLYAFQAVPRMYMSMLFPTTCLAPHFIAETYDTMTRQVVTLGCLQHPAQGMSGAL
jgi:hypothetical protein